MLEAYHETPKFVSVKLTLYRTVDSRILPNMARDLTDTQALDRLRIAQGRGTQKQLAEKLGVSESLLSDVLQKRRDLPPKLLEAMDLERIVVYRPKAKKAAKQ